MSEIEGEFHFFISLPARPDESARQPDVILAGAGLEVVQVSKSKDISSLSRGAHVRPGRIPVLDSSRKRGLSSDQKFNSTNLPSARVNVFPPLLGIAPLSVALPYLATPAYRLCHNYIFDTRSCTADII
jgi:hypothetical protein